MKILAGMVQGSDVWLAARSGKRTASEAAAVFGDHKYMTRNDLLKQKSTGLVPEVGAHQQVIFDKGHAFEAMARPIAEEITGEELFPCTCVDDAGIYLASMDGLDMLGEIGFEHKSLNEKLRTATAETLEEHYKHQMDHQMMVTGAEKILFMASNGSKEDCVWFWYERDEKRIERLIAAWEQFAKDLAEYAPAEAEAPKAEGKAPESLPALVVRASGMVEASNLKEFEAIARATLAGINTDLQTDNDFADAEKAVKFCTDVEKRLDGARENVLGQMQTVDEVVRSIDAIKEETRQIRLKLSKAVKDQKESRKLEILQTAKQDYDTFHRGLDVGQYMPLLMPDFAGAMKGKRTISSLRDACDDLTAQSKISANEVAAVIRGNLQQLSEDAEDYRFLFNDFGQLCQKPADDFAAIVKSRIADHKQAEHDRMEAERAKIRAEEEVKARREAEATAQKEADERQWVADQEALKQKQAEQANRQVAESETAKVEQASREQHGEGEKVANQPVAPAKPQAVSRPSDNEIALAIAIHFNVSQATAWIWITEIKTQEAA
jgi:predicted phage-related endonuclease